MSGDLGALTRDWLERRPYGGFSVMMVDPPWQFENYGDPSEKSPDAHYVCEAIDWVRALPIGAMAGNNCLLWLWATGANMPQALTCLEPWGFRYSTMGWWSKKTVNGKQAFGTGHVLRCAGEPFIIGIRGKVKTTRSTRNTIEGPVREHSRKPEEAYREIERLVPADREDEGFITPIRADVFSRQARPGWQAFGNEIDKFAA